MRFDVPVIGQRTLETAAQAGITLIALEAGKTLLLESDELKHLANQHGVTLWGVISTFPRKLETR